MGPTLISHLTNLFLPATISRSHRSLIENQENNPERNIFGKDKQNCRILKLPGTKALDSCEPEKASTALIPMDCSVPQAKDNQAMVGLATIRGAHAVIIEGAQKLLPTKQRQGFY